MIAVGGSLKDALALAVEVETLAEMYWRALADRRAVDSFGAEMKVVLDKFKTYGADPAQPTAKR